MNVLVAYPDHFFYSHNVKLSEEERDENKSESESESSQRSSTGKDFEMVDQHELES